MNCAATKLLAVEFLDSTISIITIEVLKNSSIGGITINVSERNTASISAEIFEVLPAGVAAYACDENADTGRST